MSRSPQECLRIVSMARLEPTQREIVELAAHEIVDAAWMSQNDLAGPEDAARAVKRLDELAGREEWWLRLYAAKMLLPNPRFRNPRLVASLRADPSLAVRKAMDRLVEKQPDLNHP